MTGDGSSDTLKLIIILINLNIKIKSKKIYKAYITKRKFKEESI
jgi:hypothetical protein